MKKIINGAFWKNIKKHIKRNMFIKFIKTNRFSQMYRIFYFLCDNIE